MADLRSHTVPVSVVLCFGLSVSCLVVSCVSRFIEHGEYKENQYGTSIEAIRSVQAKNKMCLVDVQPEVRPRHILCSEAYPILS